MSTPQFRNAVLRKSMKLAMAALLCLPLGAFHANNPKPTTASKPAAKPPAPAKPAGAAKPDAKGKPKKDPCGASAATAEQQKREPCESSAKTKPPTPKQPVKPVVEKPVKPVVEKPVRPVVEKPDKKPVERVIHTPGGSDVHRGVDGGVTLVHTKSGLDIHHRPGGEWTTVRTRPDGTRVVGNRHGHGYVGHLYQYRGVDYERRTYYYNGRVYRRFYRPYTYWGVPLNVYAPAFYYAPGFYGWAYHSRWARIAYPWGWAGSPWYGYYGAYFTPYATYASPALWLTDYYVAQTLQAAYAERVAEASGQAQAPAPMTPAVKEAIAEEVRRQIALESSEAAAGAQATPDSNPGSSGIARILADNSTHVFIVSAPLDATTSAGTCGVTEGDVLQLNPGAPPNSTEATMIVMASKRSDCPKGISVQVGLSDLQEMQNHMRETIGQGLGELQASQGHNGIPAAPTGTAAPPVQTGFAAIAPPPDPNVKAELSDQTKEAGQADREAAGESSGPNAA